MTRLGLKARIDIPVAGTMINVVNDRLSVENPPNGWPITAESGWQEYHNKVNQTFEEIVADLANTRFNKTVFEGTATAQAFEWDIAMETYWPAHYGRFRENWDAGAHTQGVGRSRRLITWPEWYDMYRTLPHSQPIGLVQSAYVTSLLRGDCTKLVQHQHIVLYERQNAAASLGMHMYGFRVVLKDTFAPGDLDTVINQLVFRGHGDLEQFVDDRDLFVRVVGEIMDEFNMQQPTEADTIREVENKWIRIFWGRANGIFDHPLSRKMFYGSPILPMKGLNVVVSDHKAYTAQRMSSKGLFFLFASPIPLMPAFFVQNVSWLSGFEVGHTHTSEIVDH